MWSALYRLKNQLLYLNVIWREYSEAENIINHPPGALGPSSSTLI